LPAIFQKRIRNFREANKNFRWDYESYEMFCCEEAIKIANCLKTEDKIITWAKLDWNEQVKQVPIDEGHSGNTFGCAVQLARLYVAQHQLIEKAHGALANLVGCKEYGCKH
jgi:hypothetical protein